ncbi:MAG: hypothetical protein WCI12_00295 [Actinomycetes bacterium]
MTTRDLFADVPGQRAAVAELLRAAVNPVHAYLFVGPQGAGKEQAAVAFAAALLCPDGGCGTCGHCSRVFGRGHPDLVVATHDGVAYSVKDDVRPLTTTAQRRPLETSRLVVIIPEAHLLGDSLGALLKTLEEPPATTVFILLADDVTKKMATIRSRCVVIPFAALSNEAIIEWLVAKGIDEATATQAAQGAAGDADRAMLLTVDAGFADRLTRWRAIPDLLDGTGAVVGRLAQEIKESMDEAVAPLVAQHDAEMKAREAEAKSMGERGVVGRTEIIARNKRQVRAYRMIELRAGLGVLARVYRDRMAQAAAADDGETIRRCATAVDMVSSMAADSKRNLREVLSLEGLLFNLPVL